MLEMTSQPTVNLHAWSNVTTAPRFTWAQTYYASLGEGAFPQLGWCPNPEPNMPSAPVVRLANVVIVAKGGVELVTVQDEGFACALCLNSEEVREQVERVETRGGRLLGFRKRLFFFRMRIVCRDRVKFASSS